MTNAKQWMPRPQWDAMKAGRQCPMCKSLTPRLVTPGYRDEHGSTIATLNASILRLATDQHTRGKCILISTNHGPEPHDLSEKDWQRFAADIRKASRAIVTATGCDKLNVEILGNQVAHLHAHLTTRYYGDNAPGARLIRDHANPMVLSPTTAADLARTISDALAYRVR